MDLCGDKFDRTPGRVRVNKIIDSRPSPLVKDFGQERKTEQSAYFSYENYIRVLVQSFSDILYHNLYR